MSAGILTLTVACKDETRTTTTVPEPGGDEVVTAPAQELAAKAPPVETPPPPPEIPILPPHKASLRAHPAGEAWVIEAGQPPRSMDIALAESSGYTVIDLSDRWVPFIFWDRSSDAADTRENRYAETFVALANNTLDPDDPGAPPTHPNYLELFGIPPTPGVLSGEFETVEREVVPCLEREGFDSAAFEDYDGYIAFDKQKIKTRRSRARWLRSALGKAMRKARLDPDNPEDVEAAKDNPRTAKAYRRWHKAQATVDVIRNTQRRLACAGLYGAADPSKAYRAGNFGWSTHQALADFQRKHAIFGWGHITSDDLAVLQMSPAEATRQRVLRMLAERLVTASGVVEDGSAALLGRKFPWTDADGVEHGPRDVVGEQLDAVVAALGWDTPDATAAGLKELYQLRADGFENLLIAVKLPELPPYYGPDMEFSVVIDRGDVFYDLPYDEEGNPVRFTRRRKPHLTLYVHHEGQKIPLVYWNTTIGSWRSEQHDGQEWLAYKNSDVGARIWRDIVAAPVWIPPNYTPTRSLLKRVVRDGKYSREVNYDETGPGFRSAYGLVAAYHIQQIKNRDGEVLRELDHQIRTHGSVDYMSIKSRYSHGCHRLHNGNAVRLFSFLLQHNDFTRHGQTELGYARSFEFEDDEYTMKLDTRGYRYELASPIPVLVTKGRIAGEVKEPFEELIPKPGAEPPTPTSEEGAGTDTAGGAQASPASNGQASTGTAPRIEPPV